MQLYYKNTHDNTHSRKQESDKDNQGELSLGGF